MFVIRLNCPTDDRDGMIPQTVEFSVIQIETKTNISLQRNQNHTVSCLSLFCSHLVSNKVSLGHGGFPFPTTDLGLLFVDRVVT